MSPSAERWPKVEEALSQLGVEKTWRIKEIRKKVDEIASMGTPLMPDFTLHNITHSDNLILIFGLLQKKFGVTLGRYEAYLLAASAYLHDLGMFFSGARFRSEILPDLSRCLFCPEKCCDHIGNYLLQAKDIGTQIRLTHNLLSAYRLLKDSPSTFGIEFDDRPYLITICRGHRKVDLKEQSCGCYRARPLSGEVIRLALLTALLRISDALDFYENRAPASVFEHKALDFLQNPTALEHWLKHYFVTDPYITRRDESGNISLECIVNFAVPMRQINGRSYLDFFRPLFEKHVAVANATDLDIQQYPPDLTNVLNIVSMKVTLRGDKIAGFRDLPVDIIKRIEQSQCENVMTFLEWLSTLPEAVDSLDVPVDESAGAVEEKHAYLWLLKDGEPMDRIHLEKPVTLIGRALECNLRLKRVYYRVSRKHARVEKRDLAYVLLDGDGVVKSEFGTYANGEEIDCDSGIQLRDGDLIILGGVKEDGEGAKDGACILLFRTMNDDQWEEITKLLEALQTHKSNLAKLEVTKAKYGMASPLQIINEMDDAKKEIARLTKVLTNRVMPTF